MNPLGPAFLGYSTKGGARIDLSKVFVTDINAPAGGAYLAGGARVISTDDNTTWVGLRAKNGALYINLQLDNTPGLYGKNGAINIGA